MSCSSFGLASSSFRLLRESRSWSKVMLQLFKSSTVLTSAKSMGGNPSVLRWSFRHSYIITSVGSIAIRLLMLDALPSVFWMDPKLLIILLTVCSLLVPPAPSSFSSAASAIGSIFETLFCNCELCWLLDLIDSTNSLLLLFKKDFDWATEATRLFFVI